MKQEVTNFARFYTILKRVPLLCDKESTKRELVSIITGGRTDNLREMTRKEYNAMCDLLDKRFPEKIDIYIEKRRKQRSICLKLMQRIGVNTVSWTDINKYCSSPRIAGKLFADLDIEELKNLSIKLRMILKKKEDNE